MEIKSYNIITILIFFTLFNNISLSQNGNSKHLDKDIGIQNNGKISISLKGGMVFQSLDDWIDGLVNSDIYDSRKQGIPSFITSLYLSYQLSERQFIDLGISMNSADIRAYNNSSSVNLNFKTYPISVSYKYFTKINPTKLKPFIGAGINYLINRVNFRLTSTPAKIENSNLNSNGYGLELFTGLLYSLDNKINLLSELKLIYQDANAFSRFQLEAKSLSIYLLFGVGYTL